MGETRRKVAQSFTQVAPITLARPRVILVNFSFPFSLTYPVFPFFPFRNPL